MDNGNTFHRMLEWKDSHRKHVLVWRSLCASALSHCSKRSIFSAASAELQKRLPKSGRDTFCRRCQHGPGLRVNGLKMSERNVEGTLKSLLCHCGCNLSGRQSFSHALMLDKMLQQPAMPTVPSLTHKICNTSFVGAPDNQPTHTVGLLLHY